MLIIHKDCDKSLAKDRNLPLNSYLVTYILRGKETYDIVQASSFVEVFDNYYDQYGKDTVKQIKWTEGRFNPKLYEYKKKKDGKKV